MLAGSQVWEASLADPNFAAEMPEGSPIRSAIKPFIEAAPSALAEFLDKPLTLRVLGDSKIAFLRYCLTNDFGEKMGDATGFGGALIGSMLEKIVDMLDGMLKDLPGFLEEHGVSEDQVMLSPKVGLNADNRELYKAGKLTVADVLRTQPAVIVKNNSD